MQHHSPVRSKGPLRFVTAASLFDGHDASINIMRRILQASGAEVIHLGHNRSVSEIVTCAIQEDVHGIAVSSYQGGHMEYFTYMVDLLNERGASHIRVFGGGGGVIVPEEIQELHRRGVARIFSVDDGMSMGLQGMIDVMLTACDTDLTALAAVGDDAILARAITTLELDPAHIGAAGSPARSVPVLGITGTGGAGKSSLTDELIRRFLDAFPERKLAVVSVDPTKFKTGGALLGDRIRMNSVYHPNVHMRSLATRGSNKAVSDAVTGAVDLFKAAGHDLILVETSGIGQSDLEITTLADISLYVMTSEFGAPSQLEKINMLDLADLVVINKFEKRGSQDALRDVRKQIRRSRMAFESEDSALPVYPTIAAQFNDPGVNRLFGALTALMASRYGETWLSSRYSDKRPADDLTGTAIIPARKVRYLSDIADLVREHHQTAAKQADVADLVQHVQAAVDLVQDEGEKRRLRKRFDEQLAHLLPVSKAILDGWESQQADYRREEMVTTVRDKEIRTPLYRTSLSGTHIPRIALPGYRSWGDRVLFGWKENLPGSFPFTAGVFPFKRDEEDPARMFAGEGTPARTNRRFHYLSEGMPAKRLSTAFDSVTLYGEDPDERPDIYGKIGNSGVSVCCLDDMKILYQGFRLTSPDTSVSMTINGPAPMILAMYLNTAIEQEIDGRMLSDGQIAAIKAETLATVRGTVQADILKEDQAQNTCIFSTEFALRMMGDIQAYFTANKVRNYYSVSISGYHIAEAGANPITQAAFTLANGLTFVEYYLSRGMSIDDFAHNLSFFFSNGLDPEYAVIGRVARRIWAIAMKKRYGANERSQKLKYHIQTSGRSLHAKEIQFNDIRTTLQALMALNDHCNSLHTNAYDEAITTPTEESVRRALAIQLIINKELGLSKNENGLQGSYIIRELTDLVEEAILQEFDRLTDRGGVLGAMETMYQRSKIQEESLHYETLKHNGELPIIGVNTFKGRSTAEEERVLELIRSTDEEKRQQITQVRAFKARHADEAPMALARLNETARLGGNLFEELMETVKVCSLGQITHALYKVGGQYRRSM
jgi:isobutyryl-CoA mutase